ncbi:MAG: DUF4832 domain-containing protein [Flavobacteriales bacterium]|nr:DUF4832 domain-containing protein [Flavobacteriales bacterium]
MSTLKTLWIAGIALVWGMSLHAQTTVSYSPTGEDFPNPERGFYTQITGYTQNTQGWAAYQPIDPNYLAVLAAENQTLALRLYYMPEFVDGPLSQQFLDLVQEDMDILRTNGFKGIVRFAYSVESFDVNNVDTVDAPVDVVLQHIDQLAPVLQQNTDVIAALQAGFIGAYGEWATINNVVPDFMDANGIRNLTNRKRVLDALLAALPERRIVQVRTPYYKYAFYYWDQWDDQQEIIADPWQICPLTEPSPLNETGAYSGTDMYRVGQHNDCFLASSTDFGTYCDSTIAEGAWLVNETRYMPMGGETCFPNSPRSDCASEGGAADTELMAYHWSYLNSGYHPDVLSSWETDGCMDEIAQKLGYRIELLEGTYDQSVAAGCALEGELVLRNVGYAAPFNPRGLELLLVNATTGATFMAPLDVDPRFWFPESEVGLITIPFSVGIPADFEVADYDLFLHLPDPEPLLYGRPEYSIRLANDGVWDAETGFNSLMHSVSVTSDLCAAPVDPDVIAFGCNAGTAEVSDSNPCCGDPVVLQAQNTSYFGEHTIAWVVSGMPVTQESELVAGTILPQSGVVVELSTSCDNQGTYFATPYLAVNDHTYNFVFEDTLQFYWASSMTISLDLTNAGIPYDVAYGNLIELEVVNLSPYFDQNGGTSNFVADPGIGITQSEFNVPTLPPGEVTYSCSWIHNPNTTYDFTVQDATAGIGGQFIVRLSVFVPFPTIDDNCSSFGAWVSWVVGNNCCPGDFNGDGFVNVSDLLLFLGDFNCQSACIADMDATGDVTTTDLLLFLGLIGAVCE